MLQFICQCLADQFSVINWLLYIGERHKNCEVGLFSVVAALLLLLLLKRLSQSHHRFTAPSFWTTHSQLPNYRRDIQVCGQRTRMTCSYPTNSRQVWRADVQCRCSQSLEHADVCSINNFPTSRRRKKLKIFFLFSRFYNTTGQQALIVYGRPLE